MPAPRPGHAPVTQAQLRHALLRLNARAWGISVGLLFGLGLFIATNVLVFRGGETVGPHLGLLSMFFPGYSVSLVGSLIGFVYAFVVGYLAGRLIGVVYNRLAG
ncbi:MAG TPA: hypothetical protein VGE02_16140 [Gemmatimonadales bacterium]